MTVTQPRVCPFEEARFLPRFAYGDQAEIAEICGTADDTQLGTGFARLRDADIPWTVKYDEVLLVLEGEVSIQVANGTLKAGPRDCVWLPKGTELRYRSRDALVFYAIHPADWNGADG